MWKTKDGKLLRLSEMTNSHLANAIEYSKRRGALDSTRKLEEEQKRRQRESGFDPKDDNPEHALTFEEWSSSGYRIKKGAKAVSKNILGESEFLPNQVWKARNDSLWEQCTERSLAKGTPWGVVEDFDSFVREAGMLPDGKPARFSVTEPLEKRFMEIADKHGVIDAILDDEEW